MRVETEVNGIEKLHPLRVGVVEYFTDRVEPDFQLVVFLDDIALVSPVGSESLLGDIVHSLTTYLYLDPLCIGSQYGEMESLIAVALGGGEPVA